MPRPSARYLAMGVVLLAAVLFLLRSLEDRRQPTGDSSSVAVEAEEAGENRDEPGAPRPAAPGDAGFEWYEELAARSVFEPRKAPSPPKTQPRKPPKVVEPPPFPGDRKRVEKAIDLTGWSYAGYVMLDDRKFGIVQHESSTSVEFLRLGDSLLGAEVTEITDEVIRFKSGTRRTTLSRPENFPVTPLDSAASGAPQTPRRQRGARRTDR